MVHILFPGRIRGIERTCIGYSDPEVERLVHTVTEELRLIRRPGASGESEMRN